MTISWDGVTKSATLHDHSAAQRHQLADAARAYDWSATLALLDQNPDLINVTRPDGAALYAPLHQAAHGNAPVAVVKRLIELGAWRTLTTASGERAVDIATHYGHDQLIPALTPRYRRQVPPETLMAIQRHFHVVIIGRAHDLVEEHALRLPELAILLEIEKPNMWFAVPGMYGGFSYWLETVAEPTLIAESWSRVAGGSGQRHAITATGSTLVEEGFV